MTRDHGGNLDAAMRDYGGDDWLDLSTGINPCAYPVPPLPPRAWTALPTRADMAALTDAARQAYRSPVPPVPLAGAQSAIQALPRIAPGRTARVLAPTYNEHAGALRQAGWQVEDVASLDDLTGADLAVIVNPNNPDGRVAEPETLERIAAGVGTLVVDESFGDVTPELSIAPRLDRLPNVVVLRSFGKFFGLAGLRLGFALAAPSLADAIRTEAGPWPVSGAAIHVGRIALLDGDWQAQTRARLTRDAHRLDKLAMAAGWGVLGGCDLFRTYVTPDAAAAQDRLARARIWSRIFPYSDTWLRLGLPDGDGWPRLEDTLN